MEVLLGTIKPNILGMLGAADFYGGFFRHLHDHFVPNHRNNYYPHLLSHRSLGLLSALLVAVKIFTIAVVAFGSAAPVFSSAIVPETIIELTNKSRTENSLPALTENLLLSSAAQAKADDMLARGYFSHNTPDGKTPWDFVNGAGYTYLTAGENLAVNFTEAESVEQAWMNSPSHRANIVNKNFEEIGIGIARGVYQDHEAVFVVQMFASPVEQKIAISDVPTKVQGSGQEEQSASMPASAEKQATVQAVGSQTVAVEKGEVLLEGQFLKVTVKTTNSAVKVLARYGRQAVMLDPKGEGLWEGVVPLSSLTGGNSSLAVRAYDMSGNVGVYQVGDFAPDVQSAFRAQLLPQVAGAQTQIFGRTFSPQNFEYKFYLLFIATMLSSLGLAIALKRHVQHLSLIANSSFVIILASLLYIAG